MTPVDTNTTAGIVCPQCNYGCKAQAAECPRCRVVFAKIGRVEERREAAVEEGRKLGDAPVLERLASADCLLVRQETDRMEAFTGFEQANRYTVLDALGNPLLAVAEESGVIARQILGEHRPFTMHIATTEGQPVLHLERPFRFFFHEITIHDARGQVLGLLRKRWSVVNRRYTLANASRGEEYEIFGPLLKPWTFQILRDGCEIGAVRKKWSGALRELFTDSDLFGVEFPRDLDIRTKALFLGAVFLIDFLHFEDNNDD